MRIHELSATDLPVWHLSISLFWTFNYIIFVKTYSKLYLFIFSYFILFTLLHLFFVLFWFALLSHFQNIHNTELFLTIILLSGILAPLISSLFAQILDPVTHDHRIDSFSHDLMLIHPDVRLSFSFLDPQRILLASSFYTFQE